MFSYEISSEIFLAIKVSDESLTLPPPLDPSAPIAKSGRNCSDWLSGWESFWYSGKKTQG